MDGQISPQANFFNTPNLLDHHPPYFVPFQVAGLAPGLVQEEKVLDSQWNFGLEPEQKRPKEQIFLEGSNNANANNSQMSSADLLQARSVSTGLGLSLENPRMASSGDAALLGLGGDNHNLDLESRRQDAEIDRYIRIQGDHLRRAVLEKFQANQLQTISYVEQKALQKLREKEAEIDAINKKNMELELRMEQLALEANAWQQEAKYNENIINTLKHNLQQLVYAQSRDSKEGCGDSEVDDTASCCNGFPVDKIELMMTWSVCKLCYSDSCTRVGHGLSCFDSQALMVPSQHELVARNLLLRDKNDRLFDHLKNGEFDLFSVILF